MNIAACSIKWPIMISFLVFAMAVFLSGLAAFKIVKKTFLSDADHNEFAMIVQPPVESSLDNIFVTVKRIGMRTLPLSVIATRNKSTRPSTIIRQDLVRAVRNSYE